MAAQRILLDYLVTDTVLRETTFTQHLVADIQTAGGKVVKAYKPRGRRRDSVAFPAQELHLCTWLILIQHPEELASLRVQTAIQTALTLFRQQRVEGFQLVIATSSHPQNEQYGQIEGHERNVNQEHEKAQKSVLLQVHFINLDDNHVTQKHRPATKLSIFTLLARLVAKDITSLPFFLGCGKHS